MAASLLERIRKTLNTPRHLTIVIAADWVLCSQAYWLIERHVEDGPTGPISGLWWGIVTASTVGYGDYSPETTPGRAIGAFLILSMWALTLLAAGQFAARAVEDNSPAAFTADEQDRMFRMLTMLLNRPYYPDPRIKQVMDALDRIERFDAIQSGAYGQASRDALTTIRNALIYDPTSSPNEQENR